MNQNKMNGKLENGKDILYLCDRQKLLVTNVYSMGLQYQLCSAKLVEKEEQQQNRQKKKLSIK